MDAFVLIYRHSALAVKYCFCGTEYLAYMTSYAIAGYEIDLCAFIEGGCPSRWNSIRQI
jgi:hypothetical protein